LDGVVKFPREKNPWKNIKFPRKAGPPWSQTLTQTNSKYH
jgi:hypothetical protein